MTAYPLISILMPLYNSEQWIEKTINSCQSQTYQNWELIVVDDGSKDHSAYIVEQLARSDSRIKLQRQINQGACAARNMAFKISKGQYIMYLDADDLISKNKLESQIAALESKDDNAIAFCKWSYFKNNHIVNSEDKAFYHTYNIPLQFLLDLWNSGSFVQTACYLIPRHIIAKIADWDIRLKMNQDGEFFCRAILASSKIIFVPQAHVFYRRGHESISSSNICTPIKQFSRLLSFRSYQENILKFDDSVYTKKTLAKNYARVACATYNNSDLYNEAIKSIHLLGIKPEYPYPNKTLKIISKWFGLKIAIRVRNVIK